MNTLLDTNILTRAVESGHPMHRIAASGGRLDEAARRIRLLRERHDKKPSILKRMDKAGL